MNKELISKMEEAINRIVYPSWDGELSCTNEAAQSCAEIAENYAKERAIAFAEWILTIHVEMYEDNKTRWCGKFTDSEYTSKELYTEFMQANKK